MGLFKRKDSPYWWYKIKAGPNILTGSTSTGDRRLASKIFIDKQHQFVEGTHLPSCKARLTPFCDMAHLYLEKHAKVNKKSVRDDVRVVRRFEAYFEGAKLADITPQRIEEYKASRMGVVKQSTINRELAILKSFFSKAVLWGYAKENPVKAVRLFREELKPVKILSPQERKRLFECSSAFLVPIILMALKTGMRRGEILGLRWEDVDMEGHNIFVRRTKSGKMRVLPIHPELYEVLAAVSRSRGGEHVFCDSAGNRRSDFGAIRTSFELAVKRAGLGKLTFHDLRHNFATELVQKGADLRTVQEYLGHSTLLMVQRYSHVTEGIRRSTIQLLGHEFSQDRATLMLRSDKVGLPKS